MEDIFFDSKQFVNYHPRWLFFRPVMPSSAPFISQNQGVKPCLNATWRNFIHTRLLSIENAGSVQIIGVQQVQIVAHPLVEVIGFVFVDDIRLDHQDEFTARVLLSR